MAYRTRCADGVCKPPGGAVFKRYGAERSGDGGGGGNMGNGNDNPELYQYYYHSDHLGSSSFITNLDGEVAQHIEYVPFGEVFIEEKNNNWNTPYKFNGKELDDETGLYYYGARYMDPKMSLWLSVDPLAEKYSGASPFAYCLNNPVRLTDPSGMAPDDWVKGEKGNWLWKDNIKTKTQALKAGYKDYRAPKSIVDNPNYNKVDPKTKLADGNKKIMLGENGKIFVGVLGLEVRSNVGATLSDGHTWLALYDIEFKGKTTSGLWPDGVNAFVNDNGPGHDIRMDVERDRGDKPTAAFYQGITKEQQDLYYNKIFENVTWQRTYNCTTWAIDCFEAITKVHFNGTEPVMGTNVATPRVLDKVIYNSNLHGANAYPENRGKNDGGSSY